MNFSIALLYIALHVVGITFGQRPPDFIYYSCGSSAGDPTYLNNLNNVLDSISSFAASGFYNFPFRQDRRIAYGIGLCEGNIESDTCRSCLANSTIKLKELCFKRKEAIGWYENCMLRYSDRSIFHNLENKPDYCFPHEITSSWNTVQFNSTMKNFMAILQGEAARRSSKFANGSMTYADNVIIHGLVQCTPDLSEQQCNECLDNILGVVSGCFLGKIGGKAATPSCNIRYRTQLIDKENTSRVPPTTVIASPPSSGGKRKKIAITACLSASFAGAVLLGFCYRRRKLREWREAKETRQKYQEVQLLDLTGETLADEQDVPFIPPDVICTATQQFAKENKLGQGGFGPVYKIYKSTNCTEI